MVKFDLQEFIRPVTQDARYAEACKVHAEIVGGGQLVQQGVYQMGTAFKRMREEKLYESLGYLTFADYCEKETGLKKSQVYSYITICEKLPEDFLIARGNIGIEKMKLLSMLDSDELNEVTESTDVESATVKELKEKIKELSDSKEKAEQEAEQLRNFRVEDTEQYQSLKNANTALEMLRSQQSEKLEALKADLENAMSEKSKLETQIGELETKLHEVPETIDVADTDEYKLLEAKNRELTEKIDDLSEQMNELENRPVEVAVEKVQDDEEIKRLSALLEKAKQDLSDAKDRLKRSETRYEYKNFIVKMSDEEYGEFLSVLESNPKLSNINFLAIMKAAKILE